MRSLPIIGIVQRRLLLNYRVDPAVLRPLLPAPFEPLLVRGYAVAGTCLLRVGRLRPLGLPSAVGIRLEGAAHRIAVQWEGPDGPHTAVYIHQRETASRAAVLVGGRLFPGRHHRAQFSVAESSDIVHVNVWSEHPVGSVDVCVRPQRPEDFRGTTLFPELEDASSFFRDRSDAYSTSFEPNRLDGLRMTTGAWAFEPTAIEHARSSFFDDVTRFPHGSVELDSAFLMRDVPVRLSPMSSLAVTPGPLTPAGEATFSG